MLRYKNTSLFKALSQSCCYRWFFEAKLSHKLIVRFRIIFTSGEDHHGSPLFESTLEYGIVVPFFKGLRVRN